MKQAFITRKKKRKEISAGGVMINTSNPNRNIALIGRRTKDKKLQWILPRGHQEANENLRNTAKREIFEETGLHGLYLSYLGKYNYTFMRNSEKIFKTVCHFLFQYTTGELHTNDAEVEQAIWIPINQALNKVTFSHDKKIILCAMRWPKTVLIPKN